MKSNFCLFVFRVTLGNQLDGVKLLEPDVVRGFKKRYPTGFNVECDSDDGATPMGIDN